MKRNRPVLWYDKKGAPRSEPFKLTLSQIGRDILEVNRRETGASEVETRRLEIGAIQSIASAQVRQIVSFTRTSC
jgi:hypothetical protein